MLDTREYIPLYKPLVYLIIYIYKGNHLSVVKMWYGKGYTDSVKYEGLLRLTKSEMRLKRFIMLTEFQKKDDNKFR